MRDEERRTQEVRTVRVEQRKRGKKLEKELRRHQTRMNPFYIWSGNGGISGFLRIGPLMRGAQVRNPTELPIHMDNGRILSTHYNGFLLAYSSAR